MDKMLRAEQADRLLNDDTLKAALDGVYQYHMGQMVSPSSNDEQVLQARRDLLALGRFKSQLVSFVIDGRIEDRKSGP